ncbi:hypothetical protein PF004_g18325 [Phytophthora fragariae]|uniref:Alpha/beta hydrolase fold-3 domain-containing protein n=1 Tax=Phytophthora fragariae TaxID=53985 RepID=A0A6G0NCV5_9STRA|nr:hypothetical protein PF004_g18325 [Phytophthora fragariae]
MSRSALTRHALQKSLRGQSAQDQPPEEMQRRVKQDELPIYGNDSTYNLNTLLHQNILQSAYFHELYKLRTYHEVVDEIYYRVDHAEPWSPGTARIPSSCFCLLHKFFLMRLTRKQMQGLLRHTDSPYIRVVGFLYLRFTCDPEELWTWFEPYLEDPEEFNASANPSLKTTIGEWLVSLLEENNYFGTILPRIPKKIEDGIKVKLLLLSRKKERAKENLAIVDRLKPGTKVRAMYADEENEPAMYDAVITSVEEGSQFLVSFPAYGNSEKVSLGDIEFDKGKQRRGRSPSHSRRRDRSRSASRDRRRRNQSRSRSRSHTRSKTGGGDITGDLLQQVRERERRKAEAVGRDYASRPASYKGSLSLKLDRWTTRKRSRSPAKREEVVVVQPGMSTGDERPRSRSPSPGKARETEERLKKLRAIEKGLCCCCCNRVKCIASGHRRLQLTGVAIPWSLVGGALAVAALSVSLRGVCRSPLEAVSLAVTVTAAVGWTFVRFVARGFRPEFPKWTLRFVLLRAAIRTVNELYGDRMVTDVQHARAIRAQSEVNTYGYDRRSLGRPKLSVSWSSSVERELGRRGSSAQVDVFIANYRKTPEFCFPTQPNDVVAAYEFLIDHKGLHPEHIILAGDSAGGGLVMSALLRLRGANKAERLPLAAIVSSPFVDLSESIDPASARICILTRSIAKAARIVYHPTWSDRSTWADASAIHCDLSGLPPVFIQAATFDYLYQDSVLLAEKAKADGVNDWELDVNEGVPHVFSLFPAWVLPYGQVGVDKMAVFAADKFTKS